MKIIAKVLKIVIIKIPIIIILRIIGIFLAEPAFKEGDEVQIELLWKSTRKYANRSRVAKGRLKKDLMYGKQIILKEYPTRTAAGIICASLPLSEKSFLLVSLNSWYIIKNVPT